MQGFDLRLAHPNCSMLAQRWWRLLLHFVLLPLGKQQQADANQLSYNPAEEFQLPELVALDL